MTSIQHINSFFIYYTLKFEIQFFEWVFHMVLKTELEAEPFFFKMSGSTRFLTGCHRF